MLYKIIRPVIFLLKPELSHDLAKGFLKYLPNLSTLFCFNKKYANLKIKFGALILIIQLVWQLVLIKMPN